jgi:lipoyl(octanoyl) transferase
MGMATTLPTITHWHGLTDYAAGVLQQDALVAAVANGAPEQIILCEHTPVLTLGSSAKLADAQGAHGLPLCETSRGGQVTYHGPGQRVIYPVLRLDDRFEDDVRVYMRRLQTWLAAACSQLGVVPEIKGGDHLGLWLGDAKLAAFGVRVRKGVAFHGAALNVSNDLTIYHTFVPCGLKGSQATRLIDHNPTITMAQVDEALVATLPMFLGE